MNIFEKFYMFWVSSINPRFNRKLLQSPMSNLIKIFNQPERSKREDYPFVYIDPDTVESYPIRFMKFKDRCGALNSEETH